MRATAQNYGDDACLNSNKPHHRARSAQPRQPRACLASNIEVVHRRSPDGDSEQISINLQAVPSFEAFGRFLEANPFAFWVQAGQLACVPWLEAVRAAMLPFSATPVLPKASSDAVSSFSQERHSP